MNPTTLESQAQEILYLTKRVIELEKSLSFCANEIVKLRNDLDITIKRLLVLEEVRLKQRELNSTFVQKVAEPIERNKEVKAEPKKPRFKFW